METMIMNTIQSNVTRVAKDFRNHWHREFNRISDKCAVAVMTWLLSKRSVQYVVAETFKHDTPMCHVLSKAIDQATHGSSIDADDISGLDRYIEDAIETAFDSHDFTDSRDFKDAVKNALEPDDVMEQIDMDELAEKISERVVDELVRKLTR